MTTTPKRLAILAIAGEIFSINRVYDWDTLTYTDNITMDTALTQAENSGILNLANYMNRLTFQRLDTKPKNVINNIPINFKLNLSLPNPSKYLKKIKYIQIQK